ncbi:methyl-accepting chemotaxis protein [Paenibacillus qinlingensis]|uniref:Methyl-accepting chemotaxis protein n=1 Tax=Paenibacillus qinlingensis TaxID=1837343 RepID=A0ABU1NYJ9_9BACL|nr:methyl-accepting chemotaxis protein [Paenibacillus qinlingensis]MDR6552374.1 methyl-accepting chemotaxis protein [Paenibacillus qinlingensis]
MLRWFKRKSLLFSSSLILSLVFLLIIGIMAFLLYNTQKNAAYDEFIDLGSKLSAQAQANLNHIGLLTQAVNTKGPTPDNDVQTLQFMLDSMTDKDIMTNAYLLSTVSIAKADGTYVPNVLASKELAVAGVNIGSEVRPPDVLLDAIKQAVKGQASLSATYKDAYGTWISYVSPIVDAKGETIAVIGLDYDYGKVQNRIHLILAKAIGIGLLVTLLAIALVLVLVRLVVRPLRLLAQTAAIAAQGNLTVTVPAFGENEIGQAASSFNEMIGSLRTLTVHIKQTAGEVASSSGNLKETAGQTAMATNEITLAIQQVAEGASTQLVSMDECLRAMTEMAVGIQRIAESSSSVSDLAMETTEQAVNGEQVINRTVDQMQTIEDQVVQAAATMEELNASNSKIGDILNHIADVANQTNLLALNASIEAARAGEHGKGFAVVAQEIRKLAERSKESSEEIAAILHAISSQAGEVSEALSTSARQARIGTELAGTSGKSFRAILESVKQVSEQVQEVSAASEQMSACSEQIAASLEESGRNAEAASSHSQQVAAASEEQLASVEEVARAARQLRSLAGELDDGVSRFQV